MDIPLVVFNLVGLGLAAWFWPHCARPVLVAYDTPRMAHWIGLAVTALAAGTYAVVLFEEVTGRTVPLLTSTSVWVVLILWVAVVGATLWPRFSVLVRLFARRSANP